MGHGGVRRRPHHWELAAGQRPRLHLLVVRFVALQQIVGLGVGLVPSVLVETVVRLPLGGTVMVQEQIFVRVQEERPRPILQLQLPGTLHEEDALSPQVPLPHLGVGEVGPVKGPLPRFVPRPHVVCIGPERNMHAQIPVHVQDGSRVSPAEGVDRDNQPTQGQNFVMVREPLRQDFVVVPHEKAGGKFKGSSVGLDGWELEGCRDLIESPVGPDALDVRRQSELSLGNPRRSVVHQVLIPIGRQQDATQKEQGDASGDTGCAAFSGGI